MGPGPRPGDAENDQAMERATWLAIRQPAVVRHLETRLGGFDNDTLAAGLSLACRALEEVERIDGLPAPRLLSPRLVEGERAVCDEPADQSLVAWVEGELADLDVLLTTEQESLIAVTVAAVLWAAADSRRAHDVDDLLLE